LISLIPNNFPSRLAAPARASAIPLVVRTTIQPKIIRDQKRKSAAEPATRSKQREIAHESTRQMGFADN
jgi:hypothetical protein